jgi:membrane glycosyltransferase
MFSSHCGVVSTGLLLLLSLWCRRRETRETGGHVRVVVDMRHRRLIMKAYVGVVMDHDPNVPSQKFRTLK